MGVPAEPTVRAASGDDVDAVVRFGAEVVPAHCAPLIGAEAARGQVEQWWGATTVRGAVGAGMVVVAVAGAEVVGVGQRGLLGDEHVVWKLYVHPDHRGGGLGRRLPGALEDQLPDGAQRLWLEHFAANGRAGAFYEREGFGVDRTEPSGSGQRGTDVVWRVRPVEEQRRAPGTP